MILRILLTIKLGTHRSREQFNMPSNLVLAAALHTAGDICPGASLQSGDRNGPLHDRVAGLRCVYLLYDAGKNTIDLRIDFAKNVEFLNLHRLIQLPDTESEFYLFDKRRAYNCQ